MPSPNNKMNSLDACNPALNATVSASAGSGKTWLLISRIVRLLIDGAEAGNIIALTFTRKAAGETQIRLNERLFEMAIASEQALESILQLIGCETDEATKAIASGLYEKLMHSLYPIRIQTFHSFCQDILSRFPLEADIAPGFELIEDSSLLQRQAWQLLFDEAGSASTDDSTKRHLIKELDSIMQVCNGPGNTKTALDSFLAHRSDWWAYTAHTSKPVDFACKALTQTLQIDSGFINESADSSTQKPVAQFLNDSNVQKLKIFANLLREIKNKTSEQHANNIDQALKNETRSTLSFALVQSAFIKKNGETLIQGRQHNPTLEKKLGSENASLFIALHEEISEKIQQVNEQLKRLLMLHINKAWYFAGQRYVDIYQQLKREMRLLDFTDLEWKCYQLLQHADNAHWVQYKIDQRIDHLLIDEFQDTNPTQWHLLSPILEEIAANPEQRARSVFLVGDEKQSIYSFRRANPALQTQASQWLADNLNARATPLDFSRRSSSAIIHCLNQVFEQDKVKAVMTGFTRHDTHLRTLPGKVLLCDLFEEDKDETTENHADTVDQPFRNPLKQAQEISVKTLRHKEAEYIAQQILQLINEPTLVTVNGEVRPVEFADILILMRNRTHIDVYQETLKLHGIPFIGNKKGGLLDNLEIQDLSCLLNTLITPYNNLDLAQILKSPIFNASDEDLIQLAQYKLPQIDNTGQHSSHWYERLLQLCKKTDNNVSKALQRAAMLLPRWQTLAEQLPVHDCLDKIFSEGNIINRYIAANRTENQQKVAGNCQRFLELSLETDSGRYPGIARFLHRLKHLKTYSESPPEEPLSQSSESRVRLMTIHGSKGLESPVVFLADCNSTTNNNNAYASLIRWPASESQPVNFSLQLNKDNTDQITQQLQQEKLKEQAREELNLLYVALTRAREQLFISGISGSRKQLNSWYQIIASGLQDFENIETGIDGVNGKYYKHLCYTRSDIKTSRNDSPAANSQLKIDPRLLYPIDRQSISSTQMPRFMIAPSLFADESNDSTASTESGIEDNAEQNVNQEIQQDSNKWRGIIIHRAIEQLCNAADYPTTDKTISRIKQQLESEILRNRPATLALLDDCIIEAAEVFNDTAFAAIFNPAVTSQSYNEMSLMYKQNKQAVYGIVDRVIRTDEHIVIIDYKSHRLDKTESTQEAAKQFSTQLNYYRSGINRLWPGHPIKTGILFTHHKEMVWLE